MAPRSRSNPCSIEKLVARTKADLEQIAALVEQENLKKMPYLADQPDKKEGARRTVRNACAAAEQRYAGSDGNPIHVWEAIAMCTNPSVTPMDLPTWCADYLHKTALGLIAAEDDGNLAVFISRLLRFTRKGSNAVKDRASAEKAKRAALLYDQCRFEGMVSGEALKTVKSQGNFADMSSAKKLVKKGKEMLRRAPRLSENST